MKGYPSQANLEEAREHYGNDLDKYGEALGKSFGPLFKTKWYRVVLDEAHAIKNYRSKSMSL